MELQKPHGVTFQKTPFFRTEMFPKQKENIHFHMEGAIRNNEYGT
jgi:hypothetical protein